MFLNKLGGGPWATGRSNKKVANDFNKYDHAEDMGFGCIRLEPGEIMNGVALKYFY